MRFFTCFGTILKIVVINIAVFAILIAPLELTRGFWFRDKVYCLDEVLHHAYCPGISSITRLTPEDGGMAIDNHINLARVRVASRDEVRQFTDVSRFEVINLGDSFIEADEIPFGQTISPIMARAADKTVLEFGFSSWAPFIYYNWLARQQLRNGVRVNIFLMVNDMTPHGEDTTLSYRKQARPDGHGLYRFNAPPRDNSIEGILSRHSYFYTKLPLLHHVIVLVKEFVEYDVFHRSRPASQINAEISQEFPWLDGDFSVPRRECAVLEDYRQRLPPNSFGNVTLDYLSFAFTPNCWEAEQRAEVHATAEDLNRIVDLIDRVNGSVRVYVVPPGWSFQGENLIGKMAYRIRGKTTITTLPLSQYLGTLVRVPVIPLEPVITEQKARHPGLFYFPNDGHWTPHGHRYLGRWLAENLI
jgi:hypothetical protein